MKNNYFFIKKYISKHSNKTDVLVIFALLQETKSVKKSVLKRTSNAIFNIKKVDLDES